MVSKGTTETLFHLLTNLQKELENISSPLFSQNQPLHARLTECKEQIEETLKEQTREEVFSKKIQNWLLTQNEILNVPGLTLKLTAPPSQDIEGDFFDIYQIHPSCVDVALGDVCGKGLSAVLLAMVVKTQLTRFAKPMRRVQRWNEKHIWRDDLLTPSEIIDHVLKETSALLVHLEKFVAVFYGRFDFQKQLFTYVNCGFAAPLYLESKTKRIKELSAHQSPIGVISNEPSSLKHLPFATGDLFLFYSNSILHTPSSKGELFSIERLKELLSIHQALSPDLLQKKIEEELLAFYPLHDTFTIALFKAPKTDLNLPEPKVRKFCTDLTQTAAVRKFIHSCFSEAAGASEQFVNSMQLCVTEAFCNLIHHAYQNHPRGEIVISCEQTEEGCFVDLADQGGNFDPACVSYPDFSGEKEHGFGWFIIREITDQVVYVKKDSPHGWNHLRIFKKYIPYEAPMDMRYKKENGSLVIIFEGDQIDARNSAQCKEYILDLLKREQIYSIVLDLHRLKFIDSSGLGVFLSLLKELHAHEGELKLTEMNKTVRTVFELVCMHKIFDILPTVEAALKEIREHTSSRK